MNETEIVATSDAKGSPFCEVSEDTQIECKEFAVFLHFISKREVGKNKGGFGPAGSWLPRGLSIDERRCSRRYGTFCIGQELTHFFLWKEIP